MKLITIVNLLILFLTGSISWAGITYKTLLKSSSALQLDGAVVHGEFRVSVNHDQFVNHDQIDEIDYVEFFIDGNPVSEGKNESGQFSLYYDAGKLNYGSHRLEVVYHSGTETMSEAANFVTVGAVSFAVYADTHICCPGYIPPSRKAHNCTSEERIRDNITRMKAVGKNSRDTNHFIFGLGDFIEDLYLSKEGTEISGCYDMACQFFRYVRDSFHATVEHHMVLGNHDIRNYKWAKKKSYIWRDHAIGIFDKHAKSPNSFHKVDTYAEYPDERIPKTKIIKNGWSFYMMDSGYTTLTGDQGSCVCFNWQQVLRLDNFLASVTGRTAILFWHVSPIREITEKGIPVACNNVQIKTMRELYIKTIRDHHKKIKAIFTGHAHVFQHYIWDSDGTTIYGWDKEHGHSFNPPSTWEDDIMMYVTGSTAYLPTDWMVGDPLHLEVDLKINGDLEIKNGGSIHWLEDSIPTSIYGVDYVGGDSASGCFLDSLR